MITGGNNFYVAGNGMIKQKGTYHQTSYNDQQLPNPNHHIGTLPAQNHVNQFPQLQNSTNLHPNSVPSRFPAPSLPSPAPPRAYHVPPPSLPSRVPSQVGVAAHAQSNSVNLTDFEFAPPIASAASTSGTQSPSNAVISPVKTTAQDM